LTGQIAYTKIRQTGLPQLSLSAYNDLCQESASFIACTLGEQMNAGYTTVVQSRNSCAGDIFHLLLVISKTACREMGEIALIPRSKSVYHKIKTFLHAWFTWQPCRPSAKLSKHKLTRPEPTLRFWKMSLKESFTMIFKDPVCGKRIQRGKAHVVIEYEGFNYYLCCPKCQIEFEHNLKRYARPELGEKARRIQREPHIRRQ
jgi:YHS domain-containing protein